MQHLTAPPFKVLSWNPRS